MATKMRTFGTAAYHDSMAELSRPVRWSLVLGAGALLGLVFGFAIGLAKPRFRT